MLIQNIFRQYRSSILFLILLSTVLLLGITNAYGQTPQSITIVIDDTVGVQADWDSTQNRYDPNRLHTDVTTVTLTDSGYYRIHIKILYNSGDEQTNETFFMTVLSPDGTTITPVDSNAGPYKIVFDDPGPRHTAWRDAGLFHFPSGDNTLQMHHVAAIMDEYPELLNGPLGESESVKVPDSLKLVPPLIEDRSVDLSVSLKSKTDSAIVVDSDSINITTPGGTVRYTLTVFNHSPDSAKNATLTSLISQKFNVENFSLIPQRISGDTLIWEFSSIPPLVNININYDGTVDTNIAVNDSLLITHVDLFAPMDTTNYNNSATDTILIQFPGNQPMNRSVDLEISLISETDSVLVENGDSTNVVFPGGKVRYTLTVLNHSPDSAKNVILNNLVAPNFNIDNISLNPRRVSGDSLIWEFSSFPPLSNLQIQYDGSIDTSITKNDSLLIAQARLIATNDTTAFNNSASDTILIKFKSKNPLTRSVDLGVSLNAETDSLIIVDGDSVYVTFPGGDINYILTIFNYSPDSAKNATLGSLVSQYFTAENFNLNPIRISNDSLLWEFSSLPPLSDLRIQFKGTLDNTLSENDSLLIAYAWIHAVNDTTPQNNSTSDTLLIKFPHREPVSRSVDLEISLVSETSFSILLGGKNISVASPEQNVDYTLTVFNHSPDSARDVLLINQAPRFINIENISINPNRISGDSLFWEFSALPALSDITIHYNGVVHDDIPINENFLINYAFLSASNDSTVNNNEAIDSVLVKLPTDFTPKIEAIPSIVDVTDSIQVRIQIPEGTEMWDLWIHRPDGIVDRDFADQFIISTPVTPNSWYEIDQRYTPSWLITTDKEEQLIFEIHCYDIFNNEKTAQAVVIVRSSNYLVLDRNLFRPEAEEPLGIRFKLSNRRIAQLDIYDISGRHITKITEDVYQGGWNTYPWNGMTYDGQKVGGGVYLVTLRSGEFNSWKKFILIR